MNLDSEENDWHVVSTSFHTARIFKETKPTVVIRLIISPAVWYSPQRNRKPLQIKLIENESKNGKTFSSIYIPPPRTMTNSLWLDNFSQAGCPSREWFELNRFLIRRLLFLSANCFEADPSTRSKCETGVYLLTTVERVSYFWVALWGTIIWFADGKFFLSWWLTSWWVLGFGDSFLIVLR